MITVMVAPLDKKSHPIVVLYDHSIVLLKCHRDLLPSCRHELSKNVTLTIVNGGSWGL
jgi:hypothetical protein